MGESLNSENGGIVTNSGRTTSYKNTNIPGQGCRPMDTGEWKCMKMFISLVGRVFFSNAGRKGVVGRVHPEWECFQEMYTHQHNTMWFAQDWRVTQRRKLPGWETRQSWAWNRAKEFSRQRVRAKEEEGKTAISGQGINYKQFSVTKVAEEVRIRRGGGRGHMSAISHQNGT